MVFEHLTTTEVPFKHKKTVAKINNTSGYVCKFYFTNLSVLCFVFGITVRLAPNEERSVFMVRPPSVPRIRR